MEEKGIKDVVFKEMERKGYWKKKNGRHDGKHTYKTKNEVEAGEGWTMTTKPTGFFRVFFFCAK